MRASVGASVRCFVRRTCSQSSSDDAHHMDVAARRCAQELVFDPCEQTPRSIARGCDVSCDALWGQI
jgi:hypothetical protein